MELNKVCEKKPADGWKSANQFSAMSILLVLTLALALLTAGVHAKPTVNTKRSIYTVSGTTADDIRASLTKNRPKPYDGGIHYTVKWRFSLSEGQGFCKFAVLGVLVDIRIIMPRMRNKTSLRSRLRRDWDRYNGALVRLTENQAKYVVEGARRIEKKLVALRHRSSCAQLKSDANRIVRRETEKTRRRVNSYTRKSNVRWPPN